MNQSEYEQYIANVPDFPKAGVIFKDISPLLSQKFEETIQDMAKNIDWSEIDMVVGIESRGFILGSAMALKFGKGFVPIRKKGKLPPPVIGEEYTLEYGTDMLEMRINQKPQRICLVDDVLATGGTLKAAINLCEQNQYKVNAISVLIDLQFLNQLAKSDPKLFSVLKYS